MSALRTGLTLVLGAGLGAGFSGLLRLRGPSEERLDPDTLLRDCPVLPSLVPGLVPGLVPSVQAAEIKRLDTSCVSGQSDRRKSEFREDPSVHEFHRATNADFRGSGYDRGHMAAAANHKWSQNAMDDTFLLSNIVPQDPDLNRCLWNRLEQMCRSLTKNHRSVFVCSGPLFLPRPDSNGRLHVSYPVLGRNHVAVPTHFFKVLILELPDGQGVELRSYVMPNRPIPEQTPLEHFLVPIETVERASGLLFVQNIQRATKNSGVCLHKT
ncbi:hypothetical protein WMY93_004574 [Mugilogobius chulae]|uniref:Endonuclease n=1 Tax=Mugilogobius chulae TaxID=88201 RepID=A0AAW0PSP2_9GOBI